MDLVKKIKFTNIIGQNEIGVDDSKVANRIFIDFFIIFINDNIRCEDISIDKVEIDFVLNKKLDKTIKSLCLNDKERYNLFLLNIKKILYYGYLKVLENAFIRKELSD